MSETQHDTPSEAEQQQAAVIGFKEKVQDQPEAVEVTIVREELRRQEQQKRTLFNKLNISLMVTMNMTDRGVFAGLDDFKSFQVKGHHYNIHNPFKKASSKKEVPIPEGILRSALYRILHQANEINISNTILLGNEADVMKNLKGSLETVIKGIQSTFPVEPEHHLANLASPEEEEEGESSGTRVLMRDVVRVSGWITRTIVEEMCLNNLVINLTINSGALYDDEAPHKIVSHAQTVLTKTISDFDAVSVLFGVILDPAELARRNVREMLEVMLEDESLKFTLFTKRDLYGSEADELNWIPNSKAGIDRDLMTNGGEILLLKTILGR